MLEPKYPSTISGHIGQATRDDRFTDATGPFHMVLLEECRKLSDLNPARGITAESRDPTYSSFEAFVLAPSTSSFTLYDKQNNHTSNDGKENTLGRLVADRRSDSKPVRTPQSSPLKNQVKSSMESRRTVTLGKQSFDTVRSGRSTGGMSETGSKRDEHTWNQFTRIDGNSAPRPEEQKRSSESEYHSPPSKPPSPPAVTPKTRRQLRKLSVQPISPFHINSHSLDISDRKSPSPDRYNKSRKLGMGGVQISPPASDKTIKSFSALHRASTDASVVGGNSGGSMIPLGKIQETPTKVKRHIQPSTQLSDPALHVPQVPTAVSISLPSHRPHPRIKLVRNRPVSTLSETGIPRVDTRYLDDQDLLLRLEARDPDEVEASGIDQDMATKDVTSGYWDYSIVTGIGGSPAKDLALLLRNASLMKQLADASNGGLQRDAMASLTKPNPSDLLLGKPTDSILFRNTGAPRSASDKSLTSSSTYPDDTDEPSENGRYSGKRRARHARRRGNRPPSMASLAAPLGEEDLEAATVDVPSAEDGDFGNLQDNVQEFEAESHALVETDTERDPVRVPTPEESSFGQVSCLTSPYSFSPID
ncbi:hypothetical protein QFC22_002438 [Naganishia vaughanmartiniae]|uniref:Uncharacterized protein n=1 Tax=Naganishia vaughanmartiniae TaxID=1424756 RepID=A0ACC2XEJ5_9TREE|nr:hypothetical protein QFC22_002438 [Naganishia vaughanmartiniae]